MEPVKKRGPRPPPPSTISGFVRRDVYRELNEAIEKKDGERACCLAAELAATEGESKGLIEHLLDLYGSHYISADGAALSRMCASFNKMMGSERYREGMVEVVLSMTLGLPRHDASASLLANIQEKSDCIGGVMLADMLKSGQDSHKAISLTQTMVTATSVGLPFACWDAIIACSKSPSMRDDVAKDFVTRASTLFHGKQWEEEHGADEKLKKLPCRSSRQKRAPLAMFSALMVSAANAAASKRRSTPEVPSSWIGGDSTDALIRRASRMIDEVFDELHASSASSASSALDASSKAIIEDPPPSSSSSLIFPDRERHIPPGPSLWDALSADPVVRDASAVVPSSSGWDEWEQSQQQPVVAVEHEISDDNDNDNDNDNDPLPAHDWREMKPMQRMPPNRMMLYQPRPVAKLSSMLEEDENGLPEHLRFIPTVDLLSLSRVEDSRHSARLDSLDLDPSRNIKVRTGRYSTKKKGRPSSSFA